MFGRFVRLDDYFDEVYDPGYGDHYATSEYTFDALKRSLNLKTQNPVSRFVQLWTWTVQVNQLQALLVQAKGGLEKLEDEDQRLHRLLSELQGMVDRWSIVPAVTEPNQVEISGELETLRDRILDRCGLNALPISSSELAMGSALIEKTLAGPTDSLAVLNLNHPARLTQVELSQQGSSQQGSSQQGNSRPKVSRGKTLITAEGESSTQAIFQVPGYQASLIQASQPENVASGKKTSANGSPKLVEDRFLRNEFFELEIDEERGGIRGVNLYQRRHNLLAQRLALRIPGRRNATGALKSPARYVDSVCDNLQVRSATEAVGEIETSGRFLDEQREVARFRQWTRVSRGSRVVEMRFEIEPLVELSQNPGNYFCSRLAWKHDSEELLAGLHGSRSFAPGQWLESPLFFELVDSNHQLTILTGGLPFHRRSSSRTLDSVLIAGNEAERAFRMALGIDLPCAEVAAREFITAPLIAAVSGDKSPVDPLVHLNCRNILVTDWDWIIGSDNQLLGLKLRIREVQGRSGSLKISTRRSLKFATRTDFLGHHLYELETESNVAVFNFDPFDFAQVHLNWNT